MIDREPGATTFVLWVWGACAASLLGLAWFCSIETPVWDDWANVPALTGEQPVTWEWLWSQHNEHRIPLPRLIFLGMAKLTGGSYRAQSLLNASLLIMAAGSLILAAKNLRGATSYADAFLPMIFCGPSHQRNVLVAFQIQLVISTVLYAIAVALLSRRPNGLGTRSAVIMGGILALLPLCGANGVAFVPAFAIAMIAQSVVDRRESSARVLMLALGAILGMALVVLYFRGWHSSGYGEVVASVDERLRITLQFLSSGWGDAAFQTWPWSGWVEAFVLGSGLATLMVAWLKKPDCRMRTTWLIAAFAAVGSLALGIGSGRAGWGDLAGFETRYVTLAAPALTTAYLAWCTAGPATMRFAQMSLLTLACITTWPNVQAAFRVGFENRARAGSLAIDINSGMPPSQLILRHLSLLHNSHEVLNRGMPQMKKARLGIYANMVDELRFREIPLSQGPTGLIGMRGQNGHYEAVTVDPYLVYTLPSPTPVAGVRLRYRHSNAEGLPGRFVMSWSNESSPRRLPPGRHAIWTLETREDRTTTIWINATIDRLRIQPDNKPCQFDIQDLTLLVPDR